MSMLSQFVGGTITGYTQSATLTTSQTVSVPAGTKRIEALLCGGGSVGGFGGLQVYEIPVTGSSLDLIVGAGTNTSIGGETSVSSANIKYAAVGGYYAASGLVGKPPYNVSNLLWSALDSINGSGNRVGEVIFNSYATNQYLVITAGMQSLPASGSLGTAATSGFGSSCPTIRTDGAAGITGAPGALGGGVASAATNGPSNPGGTGGAGGGGSPGGSTGSWWNGATYLSGGGSNGGNGGSMTVVSVWGLTGFAGGTGGTGQHYSAAPQNTLYAAGGGGGGGGMLGAGSNGGNGTGAGAPTHGNGGNGGNGGGGAGSALSPATPGTGGNGFAIFRFYY